MKTVIKTKIELKLKLFISELNKTGTKTIFRTKISLLPRSKSAGNEHDLCCHYKDKSDKFFVRYKIIGTFSMRCGSDKVLPQFTIVTSSACNNCT